MLQRTGFTNRVIEDAYEAAITAVEAAGIIGFTRNMMKYPFMRIFFSQGSKAFEYYNKMNESFFDVLHGTTGMTKVAWMKATDNGLERPFKEVATVFHKAVKSSFTKPILNMMDAVESSLVSKSWNAEEQCFDYYPHFDGALNWFTGDGFDVKHETFVSLNLHGYKGSSTIDMNFGGAEYQVKSFRVTTDELDKPTMARTTVVNFTHSVDATLLRVIIGHLRSMGVKNISAIHDCVKVDASNQENLRKAIVMSYMEMFGSESLEDKTTFLPYGNAIRRLLVQGLTKSLDKGRHILPMIDDFVQRGKPGRQRKLQDTGRGKTGQSIKDAICNPKSTYFK